MFKCLENRELKMINREEAEKNRETCEENEGKMMGINTREGTCSLIVYIFV